MVARRGPSPEPDGSHPLEYMSCRTSRASGEVQSIRLGHPLLEDYLAFVAARARTNTWAGADVRSECVLRGGRERAGRGESGGDVFAFRAGQRTLRRG